jgi:hypothetical protein
MNCEVQYGVDSVNSKRLTVDKRAAKSRKEIHLSASQKEESIILPLYNRKQKLVQLKISFAYKNKERKLKMIVLRPNYS